MTFLWFKKEKVEMSQMSDFKLNNVNPEDSGNYYCEAKNEHGKMESNIITIDVKCEFYVLCKQMKKNQPQRIIFSIVFNNSFL